MRTRNIADGLTLPTKLAAEVQAVANEEHRPPAELVCEAIERYLKDRRWRRLVSYGQARARELGLTEADLPRLIAEARQEHRQRR
jgi:hypothetical protein